MYASNIIDVIDASYDTTPNIKELKSLDCMLKLCKLILEMVNNGIQLLVAINKV